MAKTNEISYEVIKELGQVGEKKQLRIVAWNGNPAKLDIREWYTDKDGNEKCSKGISLTNEEALDLVKLLNEYLNEDDDDEDF